MNRRAVRLAGGRRRWRSSWNTDSRPGERALWMRVLLHEMRSAAQWGMLGVYVPRDGGLHPEMMGAIGAAVRRGWLEPGDGWYTPTAEGLTVARRVGRWLTCDLHGAEVREALRDETVGELVRMGWLARHLLRWVVPVRGTLDTASHREYTHVLRVLIREGLARRGKRFDTTLRLTLAGRLAAEALRGQIDAEAG